MSTQRFFACPRGHPYLITESDLEHIPVDQAHAPILTMMNSEEDNFSFNFDFPLDDQGENSAGDCPSKADDASLFAPRDDDDQFDITQQNNAIDFNSGLLPDLQAADFQMPPADNIAATPTYDGAIAAPNAQIRVPIVAIGQGAEEFRQRVSGLVNQQQPQNELPELSQEQPESPSGTSTLPMQSLRRAYQQDQHIRRLRHQHHQQLASPSHNAPEMTMHMERDLQYLLGQEEIWRNYISTLHVQHRQNEEQEAQQRQQRQQWLQNQLLYRQQLQQQHQHQHQHLVLHQQQPTLQRQQPMLQPQQVNPTTSQPPTPETFRTMEGINLSVNSWLAQVSLQDLQQQRLSYTSNHFWTAPTPKPPASPKHPEVEYFPVPLSGPTPRVRPSSKKRRLDSHDDSKGHQQQQEGQEKQEKQNKTTEPTAKRVKLDDKQTAQPPPSLPAMMKSQTPAQAPPAPAKAAEKGDESVNEKKELEKPPQKDLATELDVFDSFLRMPDNDGGQA